MISSSVNSPIYGVNRLFYLRVRCKITVAVFLTLRWYLSVSRNVYDPTYSARRCSLRSDLAMNITTRRQDNR
jgi:hypothetical protein